MGRTIRKLRSEPQGVSTPHTSLHALVRGILGQQLTHTLFPPRRLRRVFILFHASHGLNETDRIMLQSLDAHCQSSGGLRWTLQAIITKLDTLRANELVKAIKRIHRDIYEAAPTCLPPIITSAREHPHHGVDEVRASIAEACGLAKAETKVYRPP